MIRVFGIRHHGAGSAKSLLIALREMSPDAILIEGPPDADHLLTQVSDEALLPPIAILSYDPKKFSTAHYHPFAEFSPEWQAICFGISQHIPVHFIDMPPAMLQNARLQNTQTLFEADANDNDSPQLAKDPLGYLAHLAGYTDGERWWEVTFESAMPQNQVFEAILQLMTALREATETTESQETLVREAFMRNTIREYLKKGYQNIAIVCGAWHAPVLHHLHHFKADKDKALLKGIKKQKIQTTWIPWSYDRLAKASGYGAGVVSPAWYEQLFTHQPQEVLQHWMASVAKYLRDEGFDVSPAHTLEAVHLAESLAAIRQLSVAGIDEMKEAAISVFCGGDDVHWKMIEKRSIIGEKIGEVPPYFASVPLQQDIEQRVKSAQLSKYWREAKPIWLKADAKNPKGKIDLREVSDLAKSHLLHQLNLIGIRWGERHELRKSQSKTTGDQHESWRLEWSPEIFLQIIEASTWGNTLAAAAAAFALEKAKKATELPVVTSLAKQAIFAGLEDTAVAIMPMLQKMVALTTDVEQLMETLPELVRLIRYGNVRNTNTSVIEAILGEVVPRVCLGLPQLCTNVNYEFGTQIFENIEKTHYFISLLNNKQHNQNWHDALQQTADNQSSHELVRGGCVRLLFDRGILTADKTAASMSVATSKNLDTFKTAHWLEGFLRGSGLLLIHHIALWQILDRWLDALETKHFTEILALLRRSFANFSAVEREKMLQLALQNGQQFASKQPDLLVVERAERVKKTIFLLIN